MLWSSSPTQHRLWRSFTSSFQPDILGGVGVLILVHQRVFVTLAPVLAHVRVLAQHRDHVSSRSPKSAAFSARSRSW
jgi:hypothetical protein